MNLATVLSVGLAAAATANSPPLASVADVVSAASLCLEAVATPRPDPQVLIKAGWTEHAKQTPGGIAYEKSGNNVRIALVGPVCSLVAGVKSPAEVEDVMLQLDDAISPDSFSETRKGIRFTKDKRVVDFLIGPPSEQTPAGVRIDISQSESR